MKNQEIKFKSKNNNYAIIIGRNSINLLPKKIKLLCPKSKNIAIIIDKNVPVKFKTHLKKKAKKLQLIIFIFLSQ
jgi:3-dehydroquinate synthetase